MDFKHQVYLLRLAQRTSYFLSFSTNPTPTICFVMKPHDPETKAQRALLSHSGFEPLAYKHQTLRVWLQHSHTPTCNYCFYVSSKLFKSNHHRSMTTTDQSGVSFSIWYWVCPCDHMTIWIWLSTLCHSFSSDTAPVYSSCLLRVYALSRQLHFSSDSRTLCILLRPKHFGHHSFPMLLLLSGIPCLVKLDTFSQPVNLKLLWRPICLKPTSTTTSKFSSQPHSNVFWNYFNWCSVCVWVSVCVCVHMHACLCICVSSDMYVCV